MRHAFPRQGIGQHLTLRISLVDELPEILSDPLGEFFGAGVVFHHGEAALADAFLELGETGLLRRTLGEVGTALCLGPGRIAEVEEGALLHRGIVEDAVEDLQLGDALAAAVFLEPGLLEEEGAVVLPGLRHPAVAFPEETHEERARAVDLGEADGENLALLGLLLGDAPAQVDIDELDLALAAAAAELGEDRFHQQIALPREVAEGRGEEDADGARVRGGHGCDFWGCGSF
jgi:hypothetical protein